MSGRRADGRAARRGRRPNSRLSTQVTRLFWGLAGISTVALGFSVIAGIANGGQRPGPSDGEPEALRAGLLVFLATFTMAFALLCGAELHARRSDPERGSKGMALLAGGLAVCGASLLALLAWLPTWAGPIAVPIPLRIGIFVGLALVIAGSLTGIGVSKAVQRRDRGLLLGLLVIAAVVVVGLISRG